MRRFDSTTTLEEIIDIGNDKEKSKDGEPSAPIYPKNFLKKSLSEDTVSQLVVEENIPLTPPAKIKSRSRLSSAFRSLRGTKSLRKKTSTADANESGLITSGEEIETDPKSEEKDKIKKKTKLSKKFSLSIKKYRSTTPKKASLSGSGEEKELQSLAVVTSENISSVQKSTTNTLHTNRSTIQDFCSDDKGNTLNVSQISLIDLPSDNDTDNEHSDSKAESFKSEIRNLERKQNIINHDGVNYVIVSGDRDGRKLENRETRNNYSVRQFNEPESPQKFEKVRKIQITIQGKKIERINSNRDRLPTTTTSISGEDDYLTATEVDQSTIRTSSLSPSSVNNNTKLILSEQQHIQSTAASQPGNKRVLRRKAKPGVKATAIDSIQKFDQPLEEKEKIIVTQSSRDTPPTERAPPKPLVSPKNSADLNRGAIKKTLSTQHQSLKTSGRRNLLDDSPGVLLMQQRDKSPSIERGRRFPRGAKPFDSELSSTEHLSPKTGNNLQNPNLSGAIGVIETKEIKFDLQGVPPLPPTPPTPPTPPRELKNNKPELFRSGFEFSVGKSVRSQAVNQLAPSNTEQLKSILLPTGSPSPARRNEEKLKRNYIETEYYTDEEERELLESINRDSYLSGISEYSLDSELVAIQQREQELVVMPAFGDLTMDNEVSPIMTSSGDKREHLYKILIIGELGTGKTSFIKRYVHKFFSQNYRATIGVDFALKVLHWDQNTIIRLQLWDIAGQERFGNMTRVYYKDAVGAFIVFDVTRSGTFECVSKWKEDLDSKVQLQDGSPIPCILLANKCDQEKQGLVTNPDKMDEYVKENGFAGWFETSAKENINIDEAARALVNKILLNDKLISASDLDAEKVDLTGSSGYGSGEKKRDCAC